jgi:IS30 family transposase
MNKQVAELGHFQRLATQAHQRRQRLRRECGVSAVPGPPHRVPKLHADSVLFQVVRHQLSLLWSQQQIARTLRLLWSDNPEKSVSHETIYNAIHVHPCGELKRELIACLRHHTQVRKPHSRTVLIAAARYWT